MERFEKSGLAFYKWFDERAGVGGVVKVLLFHPVPKSINWFYVFGSTILTAFIFQIITGIFLAFAYVPTPERAYQSLDFITNHAYFGNILRGLHYWGASAMVFLVFIHMSAHFLTGSYKFPRELHWLTGVVLLILTIGMAFTGQLLRWNQDAYWAIVVGAQQAARTPVIGNWLGQLILGGPYIGGHTLTQIYAVHIWLIPGALITFITIHLYLVIYKGVSEWPVPGKPVDPKTYWAEYQEILHTDGEPYFPRGVFLDAVMVGIMILLITGLAIFVGAESLGLKANPITPADPKPDWYLIWYFGILALIGIQPSGAAITPYFIILFPLIGFLILFLIPLANKGERHFSRRPWAVVTVFLAGLATFLLMFLGYAEPWKPILTSNSTKAPVLPVAVYAKLPATAQMGAHLMSREACLACHQINGVGGQRGPGLDTVASQLTYGELIWRIAHGGGGMPPFGNTLTPKQVTELVAFLETRTNTPQQASGSGSP
ncbi:MAG: cytochrome b N-terminal domain-containing protein [Chloroflexota bacterium]